MLVYTGKGDGGTTTARSAVISNGYPKSSELPEAHWALGRVECFYRVCEDARSRFRKNRRHIARRAGKNTFYNSGGGRGRR